MLYPWHNEIFLQLGQRAQDARLHHGLLLYGTQGTGKHAFAEYLARFLLCQQPQHPSGHPCGQCQSCQLLDASSHPDWHTVISDKQIGVDLIRQAISKLTGTAQLGGAKTLIIYNADRLTESAANALLKTLEEPTAKTYLILVTHLHTRLLPTILSRCEKVYLPHPDPMACKTWLAQQGLEQVDDNLIRFYQSAPLAILEALENQSETTFAEFLSCMPGLLNGSGDPLELAKKWQEQADTVIGWLQHWLTDQNRQHNSNAIWQQYLICIDARQQLTNPGVNKTALLTTVLQAIQQDH